MGARRPRRAGGHGDRRHRSRAPVRSSSPTFSLADRSTRIEAWPASRRLFKPNETVYVAVQTTAAGKGTISVKWKFGTQVIDEPTKQVDYNGPASTEFHLQNSGGFPPGDYSVDVFIDGVQVGTRAFKVDKYYS